VCLPAENTKYLQRHTIDVGDEAGHQVAIFEIYRTFAASAPVINGVRLKESFSRGFSDFTAGQRPEHELRRLRRRVKTGGCPELRLRPETKNPGTRLSPGFFV
jgi:hypothetical protein